MKYMLLLRHSPDAGPAEGTPEFDAEMAQWGQVMGELGESGALVGAHGLDTEATATTVRIRDDEALVTDGPFAETKESFFSYIIIDVADLDAALARVEQLGGSVVRPKFPVGDMGFAGYFKDSEGNILGLWQSAT